MIPSILLLIYYSYKIEHLTPINYQNMNKI